MSKFANAVRQIEGNEGDFDFIIIMQELVMGASEAELTTQTNSNKMRKIR